MYMYLLSDNIDTLTGMRLVGVDGVVVHDQEALSAKLSEVLENPEIGILLITEELSNQFPEEIRDIKLNRRLPLVVEIPDRHGSDRGADFITQYVNEAIGLKL